jgi:hypothetical protein
MGWGGGGVQRWGVRKTLRLEIDEIVQPRHGSPWRLNKAYYTEPQRVRAPVFRHTA